MSNNDSIFQIRGLKTQFFTSKGIVPAVDGVDITVKKGEAVGLVGESGCGKSMTAMSTMQLLQYPGRVVAGEILLDGENLLEKTKKEMDEIRGNRITMIFQEPMTSLNPVYTIGKQVSEAILIHENVSKEEAKQRTIDIFRKVGIPEPEKRYNVFPHQLSGGLRQRVMIGMAMVCNPQLMIADEPTTALDVTIEAQILYLMKQLQKEQGTAVVMITHNLGVVAESCDYVYVMYAGKIMEEAPVRELFRDPKHPYTFGLMNSIPKMTEVKEHLYTIKGLVPNLLHLPQGCRFCPRCEKAMKVCTMYEPDLYETEDGHKVRCFLYNKEVMNSGK
ncbi:MAG: ABC transporter ATP-binding protein [Firmicutes bacterium]|nr:ABC transporter ATP-binding protein [Bacillota bacterium]MDD6816284.1 ABC transporter ATP-binding protein [Bacillota bacterium]MDD7602979.1 ABC transporter ATP-binding protein [Bacillota bacterium]MDY5856562.1 ABC transporter ATP-binding protein [Anaerovoracaceae bacterium]